MHIDYHRLSDLQFEELVIEFCVELLGQGVQGFVSGKDGGRDAQFNGVAKAFPSESSAWQGKIVIQAKHTERPDASFSEPDFSGETASSILGKEMPRIKKLIEKKELDHYILFANRRLTGIANESILKRIEREAGLSTSSIRLFDTSELDRLCKRHPECLKRVDLSPSRSPMDIDPTELANVISHLANYQQELDELMEGEVLPPEQRISPEEKNRTNGLSDNYFKKQIRPRMVGFESVSEFLANPINAPYQKLYDDTATELEAKLTAWNGQDVPYERLLEQLLSSLFNRDYDLRRNRELTRTVIFYMYCNCDIGKDVQ